MGPIRADLPTPPGPLSEGRLGLGPTLPIPIDELLEAYLGAVKAATRRAYARRLDDFARWLGVADRRAAALFLLDGGAAHANLAVVRYDAHLREAGASASVRNQAIAAIRSLVRLANLTGVVAWRIEARGPRAEAYRDTRGPGVSGVAAMLAEVRGETPLARRNRAILRLLFDVALRRGEVVGLDLAHLDLPGARLSILGKLRHGREWVTLPVETQAALEAWIQARGEEPGALFVELSRNGRGRRLSGRSVHRLVRRLGARAGLGVVRPHGLRHAAITAALDLERGDLRRVQRFSRHRNVQVLSAYDDNRADLGGDVARHVAALVPNR